MSEVQTPPQMAPLVERYIALRDKKAELKAAYDESVKDIDSALERIENHLLDRMQKLGVESVRTQFGTPYITVRTSTSAADKSAFMDFVRSQDAWELLEVRPSKTNIEAWRKEHNDLPPGLNWREERVVNVKRS